MIALEFRVGAFQRRVPMCSRLFDTVKVYTRQRLVHRCHCLAWMSEEQHERTRFGEPFWLDCVETSSLILAAVSKKGTQTGRQILTGHGKD